MLTPRGKSPLPLTKTLSQLGGLVESPHPHPHPHPLGNGKPETELRFPRGTVFLTSRAIPMTEKKNKKTGTAERLACQAPGSTGSVLGLGGTVSV